MSLEKIPRITNPGLADRNNGNELHKSCNNQILMAQITLCLLRGSH
jgi:hypothetical protein